jgi:hypothetical protein
MKLSRIVILCGAALTAVPTFAQSKSADTNMQILLDKVKADNKLVVAACWPIYDAYQKDLQGLNDRLLKMIVAYAEASRSLKRESEVVIMVEVLIGEMFGSD